jgi:hypothetical protein
MTSPRTCIAGVSLAARMIEVVTTVGAVEISRCLATELLGTSLWRSLVPDRRSDEIRAIRINRPHHQIDMAQIYVPQVDCDLQSRRGLPGILEVLPSPSLFLSVDGRWISSTSARGLKGAIFSINRNAPAAPDRSPFICRALTDVPDDPIVHR